MKFPILASFILFGFWLSFTLYHNRKKQYRLEKPFWEKEKMADRAWDQSLEDIEYIKIPYELFCFQLISDNEKAKDCEDCISGLLDNRILNLTGISNTELKLLYGKGNLSKLSLYDQRFTMLARCIHTMSELLYQKGYRMEARKLIEYGVSIQIDIVSCYRLLLQIYTDQNDFTNLDYIRRTAEEIKGLNGPIICQVLTKFHP